MIPTTTITDSKGTTYPLGDAALRLTIGDKVTIKVTSPDPSAVCNLFDFSDKPLAPLANGLPVPVSFAWTVPATPKFILGVQLRAHHADLGETGKYTILPVAAFAPNNTTVPPPPPVVTPPVVVGPPAKLTAIGACCDLYAIAANIKAAVALGVKHFRAFGSGIQSGGVYKSNDAATLKALATAYPTCTFVVRIGIKEASDTTPATPLKPDEMQRGWASVAEAFAGLPDNVAVELDNETNARHYLDLGQQDSQVSAAVVAYDVLNAKTARLALGPNRKIVGSTVGWNANARLHVDYAKAKVAAGLLNYITVFGDHAYPDGGAAMLDDQLAGVRAAIGNAIPLWITEAGQKGVSVADFPAKIPAFVATFAKYNAVPFWYRLAPGTDKARWSDDRSILDAHGNPIAAVAAGLGLTAAAA